MNEAEIRADERERIAHLVETATLCGVDDCPECQYTRDLAIQIRTPPEESA